MSSVPIPYIPAGSENKKTGLLPCTPAGEGPQPVIDKLKERIEEQERSTNMLRTEVKETDPSRYDICELVSSPRICAAARGPGLRGGWILDIIVRDPGIGRSFDQRNPRDQK